MFLSVQIPFRGEQKHYDRVIQSLVNQGTKDFELIICNDHFGMKPIKPKKTSFPQKIIAIPNRFPGWGYPLARNVCLDFSTKSAQYVIHIDSDWVLRPNVLRDVQPLLHPDVIIEGWKKYVEAGPESKNYKKTRVYSEMQIIPLDALHLCGGWDEIFFPWYTGDWSDMMRRLKKIRKFKIINSKIFFANCYGSPVKFKRDPGLGRIIGEKLAKLNTKQPILRRTVPVKVIFTYGY